MAKQIKITLVRGVAGTLPVQRKTVKALGLGKINSSVVREDNPVNRVRPGFEGGQMPLYRRVARRGFSNYPFKVENQAVSLATLDAVFEDGALVSDATLREAGVIKGKNTTVKILASGEVTKKLTVEGLKLSQKAAEKIQAAGGIVK